MNKTRVILVIVGIFLIIRGVNNLRLAMEYHRAMEKTNTPMGSTNRPE